MYSIMLFAYNDNRTSSIQIWMFISFSCLTAKSRTSNTMSNRWEWVSYLVPYFSRKALNFFTIEHYIGCGFVPHSFDYVELCFLYVHFGNSFYNKWMLKLCQMFFSASIERIMWFSCFVVVMHHIDWCAYVESLLWTWDESHLARIYNRKVSSTSGIEKERQLHVNQWS